MRRRTLGACRKGHSGRAYELLHHHHHQDEQPHGCWAVTPRGLPPLPFGHIPCSQRAPCMLHAHHCQRYKCPVGGTTRQQWLGPPSRTQSEGMPASSPPQGCGLLRLKLDGLLTARGDHAVGTSSVGDCPDAEPSVDSNIDVDSREGAADRLGPRPSCPACMSNEARLLPLNCASSMMASLRRTW